MGRVILFAIAAGLAAPFTWSCARAMAARRWSGAAKAGAGALVCVVVVWLLGPEILADLVVRNILAWRHVFG